MRDQIRKAVGALSTIADRVAMAANAVGTLVVLALVGVVNFDVVSRGVFNAPFMGAVEVVQFSMVLIVFLQLPDVVRVNRLTRSDGTLVLMTEKFPLIGHTLRHLIDGLSAILMGLIAIAIWPQFLEMWHSQDYFGVPGVFTAPWWPIKLAIFLSATLCTIIFVLKVLRPAHKPDLIRAPEHEVE